MLVSYTGLLLCVLLSYSWGLFPTTSFLSPPAPTWWVGGDRRLDLTCTIHLPGHGFVSASFQDSETAISKMPTWRSPRAIVTVQRDKFWIEPCQRNKSVRLLPWLMPTNASPRYVGIPKIGGEEVIPWSVAPAEANEFFLVGTGYATHRMIIAQCSVVIENEKPGIEVVRSFKEKELSGKAMCSWQRMFPNLLVLFDLDQHSLYYYLLEGKERNSRLRLILSSKEEPRLKKLNYAFAKYGINEKTGEVDTLWVFLESRICPYDRYLCDHVPELPRAYLFDLGGKGTTIDFRFFDKK